jgi:hypothetical protein
MKRGHIFTIRAVKHTWIYISFVVGVLFGTCIVFLAAQIEIKKLAAQLKDYWYLEGQKKSWYNSYGWKDQDARDFKQEN